MPLACPQCGSRYLKDSKPRTGSERLARLWFVAPLRCVDCHTRFVMQTVIWRDLLYARCPWCFRMDLARWTGQTFKPPFRMKVKCSLGAFKWRCEYCRMNFASWRMRREVFSFERWQKMNAGQARAEARARAAQQEAGNGRAIAAGQGSSGGQQSERESDRPQ